MDLNATVDGDANIGAMGGQKLPDNTWAADEYDSTDDPNVSMTVFRQQVDGKIVTHRVKTRDWPAYEKRLELFNLPKGQ